jgi:hypothetical protein
MVGRKRERREKLTNGALMACMYAVGILARASSNSPAMLHRSAMLTVPEHDTAILTV